MGLFSSLDISASALTANRLRMDVVSANIANANTTRAEYVNGEWQPYRRKMVVLEPKTSQSFDNFLQAAVNRGQSTTGDGVKVSAIVEDETPFKRVYQPDHPDAGEDGYVLLPNVDLLREMADLTMISRSYEANATSFNTAKSMYLKALELGR
ncbi:MAG: flagellar basal body rod protein FlgC [Bacillaceae bacterium]|nr:flagellar basal body rod protein FlgC [Bacillaceae bacterium]